MPRKSYKFQRPFIKSLNAFSLLFFALFSLLYIFFSFSPSTHLFAFFKLRTSSKTCVLLHAEYISSFLTTKSPLKDFSSNSLECFRTIISDVINILDNLFIFKFFEHFENIVYFHLTPMVVCVSLFLTILEPYLVLNSISLTFQFSQAI